MRNEHGEELDRGAELVVPAQGRVVIAPVKNLSVIAVLEPFERNGWPFDVLEEALEFEVVALGDAGVAPTGEPFPWLSHVLAIFPSAG